MREDYVLSHSYDTSVPDYTVTYSNKEQKQCAWCGEWFIPSTTEERFCSTECWVLGNV